MKKCIVSILTVVLISAGCGQVMPLDETYPFGGWIGRSISSNKPLMLFHTDNLMGKGFAAARIVDSFGSVFKSRQDQKLADFESGQTFKIERVKVREVLLGFPRIYLELSVPNSEHPFSEIDVDSAEDIFDLPWPEP